MIQSGSIFKSKQPVPNGAKLPTITFSVTPLRGSSSLCNAASYRISTVSSNEHFLKGPVSNLLIPCLVIEVSFPF